MLFPVTTTSKTIPVTVGDTITILNNQRKQTKIRLYGIDTPEKGQSFGNKAKQFTADLVTGKQVIVKVYDTISWSQPVCR